MKAKNVILAAGAVLVFMLSSTTYAQTENSFIRGVAEATYVAGEKESPYNAKYEAKKVALRQFVEKYIGTLVDYSAEAENTHLVYSLIDVWASGYVNIDSVYVDEYHDYTAHYHASVSTSRMAVQEFQQAIEQIQSVVLEQQRRVLIERARHQYAITGAAEDMVLVNAEKEEPSFRIDRHPVSIVEYQRFETGYHSDKHYLDAATGVDWNHATEYCRSRGLRLPTDIEWERALTHTNSLDIVFGSTGERFKEKVYQYEWVVEPVRKVYISAPIYRDMVRYPMKDLSGPWKLGWFDEDAGLDEMGFRCVSSETPVEPYVDTAKSREETLVIPDLNSFASGGYLLHPDYSLFTFTKVGSSRSGSFFLSIPLERLVFYPPAEPIEGGPWCFGFGVSYIQFKESGERIDDIEIPVIARLRVIQRSAIRFIVTPSAGLLVTIGSKRELGASYGILVDVGLGHYAGPFLGVGYQGYYPGFLEHGRSVSKTTFRGVVFRAGIEFPSVWRWF